MLLAIIVSFFPDIAGNFTVDNTTKFFTVLERLQLTFSVGEFTTFLLMKKILWESSKKSKIFIWMYCISGRHEVQDL